MLANMSFPEFHLLPLIMFSNNIKLLLLLCLLSPIQVMGQLPVLAPVVRVQQGMVLGTSMTSTSGETFYSYLGVPYGAPPVGNLRFKPPVPSANFIGIFPALLDVLPCPQLLFPNLAIAAGSEDCLKLAVYTPQPPNYSSPKLPVLVYIPGGNFFAGGLSPTARLGPGYILNQDVVLVVIQYRLGALGFLSTGDSASPGNYGLLDQNLALKWIQANIAAFGGDPTRVTIYGQGAGGASATYHMVSPLSTGLFHAAIAESGTALSPLYYQEKPLQWAQFLAQSFGCPTNNNVNMVSCLRTKDAFTMVTNSVTNVNSEVYPLNVFKPVIEPSATVGGFLTESQFTLFRDGEFNRVPLIIGINKDEGGTTYGDSAASYTTIDNSFFQTTLPSILNSLANINNNVVNVSFAVKAEYFDSIDVNNRNEVISTAISMNGDMTYVAPNDETISYIASNTTVYTYVFNYKGSCSKTSYGGQTLVNNADELCYIFKPLFNPTTLNPNDLAMSAKFVGWFTNFATNLNPGESIWTPTGLNNITYLRINTATDLSMQTNYRSNPVHFWNRQVIIFS